MRHTYIIGFTHGIFNQLFHTVRTAYIKIKPKCNEVYILNQIVGTVKKKFRNERTYGLKVQIF